MSKKSRAFKYLVHFFTVAICLLLAGSTAFAALLSDSEKAQKREELEKFFASALSRTQPDSPKKADQIFRFTANASTRYGYDSNVDLDDDEDGDSFYDEAVSANAEYAPNDFKLWGNQLALGVDGRYSYLGYFDRDDMDRQSILGSPYLRIEFGQDLSLETAYEFRGRLYDGRDDLSYYSNGGAITARHRLMPGLTQRATFRYADREYTDRKALFSNGVFSNTDREDDRYEVSYGLRNRTGRWTFDIEGIWAWNDSNDDYLDYNDYEDAGLDGSISFRVTERWILTGFGGWHNKMYDSRTVFPAFTNIQEDDWYYAGGRVYFSINAWSGIDVTVAYSKNDSNASTHDYDSVVTSAGYHLYF